MNPRLAKQIIYGIAYLLFLSLIIFGVYLVWFKPSPTCFDNKRNQGEAGIDCGGPCRPCEIKNLSPIETSWVKYFPAGDQIVVTAEIRNPNSDWGAAPFSYVFEIYDSLGNKIKTVSSQSFVYSGEIKYLIEPLTLSPKDVKEVQFSVSGPVWYSKTEFPEPLTQLREIKTEGAEVKTLGPTVSAYVSNKNAFPLRKIKIIAFLLNQSGTYLGASKTELENLQAFEEKFFKISFPKNIELLSAAAPSITTYNFTRELSAGSKGDDVRQLQRFLTAQGFMSGEISDSFDSATRQALINYQKAFNILPATGILDSKTREYINSLYPTRPAIASTQNQADPSRTKIYVEAFR